MEIRALHIIGGGDTGGAMAHLLPLLSALRRAGCDANLLCLGGGGLARAAAERGLPVEVLPMTTPWDPRVLPALRRRLTGTQWDIVHAHGMRANLPVRLVWDGLGRRGPTRAAFRGARGAAGADGSAGLTAGSPAASRAAPRACLFTTVHSDLGLDYSDPLRRRVFPALDRWTRARVDRIVCVSEDLRRALLADGVPEERLLVVRSGVEFDAGDGAAEAGGPSETGGVPGPTELDPDVAAAVWGDRPPAPGTFRVGTVARLVEVKDLGLFLEVIARVTAVVPDVRAAVVGAGPESERLGALSRSLGLEGVVTFPGEVRPGSAVVREFDVFLLTSTSEGIPMAVLEAMSAGVPVVATDVGGMREVVMEGVTGHLVSRGSAGGRADRGRPDREVVAAALADRAVALLSDPARRATFGAAAAARVREEFSAEVSAAVLLDAYRDCRVVHVAGFDRVPGAADVAHAGPAGREA